MASAFGHAAAAVALGQGMSARLRSDWKFWYLTVLCSILPDVDVLGYKTGVAYGDLWGHRGLTHSLIFALALGVWAAWRLSRLGFSRGEKIRLALFFALVTASHGFLDAFTNGGHGVAFFSPFHTERYFFPWTPIEVSPIGIQQFFTSRGWEVIRSELLWVFLPSLIIGIVLRWVEKITTAVMRRQRQRQ